MIIAFEDLFMKFLERDITAKPDRPNGFFYAEEGDFKPDYRSFRKSKDKRIIVCTKTRSFGH